LSTTVQVTSKRAEEGNATTSSNQRGREMGGRENYKQEESTGTGQILGMMNLRENIEGRRKKK